MGIKKLVASYTTTYGGEANRLHNVRLVAQLVDRHLIPPGAEFSFNRTTGERTVEKGFLEAPVIINGELQTGLGGGVCQVSTTVFNAAFEAGLPITARTNHSLYISHYPTGRDATVNYPGPRPALRQRHRQVAAPADVRRLVVAHGRPLRDAGEPADRDRDGAASRDRGADGEADAGSRRASSARRDSRTTASRPARRACAAACTRRPGSCSRHYVVVVLRGRAADRPRGHEAEAEGQAEAAASPDHDEEDSRPPPPKDEPPRLRPRPRRRRRLHRRRAPGLAPRPGRSPRRGRPARGSAGASSQSTQA